MSQHDPWNPDDGDPPSEAELAEARALAEALDSPSSKRGASIAALVDTALRVKATAHPDPVAAKAVTDRAIDAALSVRGAALSRPRLRLVAAAAALLLAASGTAGLSRWNALHQRTPITHDASDVFSAAVASGAGSAPTSRIYDRRMHSYRDALLRGRTR